MHLLKLTPKETESVVHRSLDSTHAFPCASMCLGGPTQEDAAKKTQMVRLEMVLPFQVALCTIESDGVRLAVHWRVDR
jgi:hypothetical protein